MMEYKGFKIVTDGMCMHSIKQPGSGAVPQDLKGLFTTAKNAMIAIDNYQPKRGAKKKDGEVDRTAEL